MPDVMLRATRDFSYSTRRLKAGDTFEASERWAKVLVGIKKAEHIREPGNVPPPPARVREAATRMAQPVPQPKGEPVPASAVKTDHLRDDTTPRPDPFDHDGDGKPGGSRRGSIRRRRTAKKPA